MWRNFLQGKELRIDFPAGKIATNYSGICKAGKQSRNREIAKRESGMRRSAIPGFRYVIQFSIDSPCIRSKCFVLLVTRTSP